MRERLISALLLLLVVGGGWFGLQWWIGYKVVSDAEARYEIVKRGGDQRARCAEAELVVAAHLYAKNETVNEQSEEDVKTRSMAKIIAAALGLSVITGLGWAQELPDYVKLASVDAGRVLAVSSPEAARAKAALDRANAHCVATNGLHNQVSYVRNELLARRAVASNVEILEGLAGILSGANGKTDCSKLLAMYVANRSSGLPEMSTHTDVVLGLRGLAKMGLFGVQISEQQIKR